jgi:flagellar hook-length control protein FliK
VAVTVETPTAPTAAAATPPAAPITQAPTTGADMTEAAVNAPATAGQTGNRTGDQTGEQTDTGTDPPAPASTQPAGAPLQATNVTPAFAVTETKASASSDAPATPAAQLATYIVPLRKGPDGVHRLTIYLNPDNLGPISLVAEVRAGAIAMHLAGGTEAAREALKSALPELQRDLEAGGFDSCSLNLGQPGSERDRYGGQQPTGQHQPRSGQPSDRVQYGRTGGQPGAGETAPPTEPQSRRGLDLHV